MRAMPRVPAGSGGRRDPGPAGALVTEVRGRRHARGIARMARSYGCRRFAATPQRGVPDSSAAPSIPMLLDAAS